MRFVLAMAAIALSYLSSGGAVRASSLRVAPSFVELISPDSATTLNLRNEDSHPINVQIRVFRWSQVDGVERLEPTMDVVASPPLTTLGPNADYVVRVVRVMKVPVAGEESYRLLIDELPDTSRRRPGAINFVLRYSIPIFFASPDANQPQVSWAVQASGKGVVLIAKNAGGRHLRISDLKLAEASRTIANRPGLMGYVLGGATMRWLLPRARGSSLSGRSASLSAQSQSGMINAMATVQSGP